MVETPENETGRRPLSSTRKILRYILDVVAGIGLVWLIYGLFFPSCRPELHPIPETTRILFPDNSQHLGSNVVEHNRFVLQNFQQDYSIGAPQLSARESTKMQTRGLYAVGLAFIGSVFLARPNRKTAKVWLFVLFYMLMMYGLDLHLADLNTRGYDSLKITQLAIFKPANLPEGDTVWYVNRPDSLKVMFDAAHRSAFGRKLEMAIWPDKEQLIYYLIPVYAVYILLWARWVERIDFWHYRKRKKASG